MADGGHRSDCKVSGMASNESRSMTDKMERRGKAFPKYRKSARIRIGT